MSEAILVVLIIVSFLAALACFFIRATACRTFVVIGTVCVLAISSLLLQESPAGGFDGVSAGIIDPVITCGDFLLLAIMFFLGCRYRHPLIVMLTGGQLSLFAWFSPTIWPIFNYFYSRLFLAYAQMSLRQGKT